MSIPNDIKAIIFDLDGTLADTMPVHIEAWTAAGREFGIEITPYMIKTMAGMPTIQTVVKLNECYGWNLEPFEVKRFKDYHYREIKQKRGKYKAIKPVLSVAKKYKGVLPMAIGTGSTRLNAIETLRDLEIIDWFDVIIAADEVENHKPYPDTFIACADHMNVPPSHCMVFEDGEMGFLAAQNAGMQYVDVNMMIAAS